MWIFTKYGFFSVVTDEADATQLKVRARAEGDLENLRKECIPALSKTQVTEQRDYCFRALISRELFAQGMAKVAEEIDYPNFKAEVMERQGHARESVYMKVWSVMRNMQDALRSSVKAKVR